MTICKLTLSSFCCIVTHDDPFSNQNQSLEVSVNKLAEFSESFFKVRSMMLIGELILLSCSHFCRAWLIFLSVLELT